MPSRAKEGVLIFDVETPTKSREEESEKPAGIVVSHSKIYSYTSCETWSWN